MADDRVDQMRTHSDEEQEPPVTTPPTPEAMTQQAAQDDEEHDEMEGTGAAEEAVDQGLVTTQGVNSDEHGR